MTRKKSIGKKVVAKEPVVVPDGFTPIADIKPEFVQASHVVSLSQPFRFLDTKQGEVEGYVQRYDFALGGPVIDPKKKKIVFLSKTYKNLNNVTHFKTLT